MDSDQQEEVLPACGGCGQCLECNLGITTAREWWDYFGDDKEIPFR